MSLEAPVTARDAAATGAMDRENAGELYPGRVPCDSWFLCVARDFSEIFGCMLFGCRMSQVILVIVSGGTNNFTIVDD